MKLCVTWIADSYTRSTHSTRYTRSLRVSEATDTASIAGPPAPLHPEMNTQDGDEAQRALSPARHLSQLDRGDDRA